MHFTIQINFKIEKGSFIGVVGSSGELRGVRRVEETLTGTSSKCCNERRARLLRPARHLHGRAGRWEGQAIAWLLEDWGLKACPC